VKSGISAYFQLIYRELDSYATWLPGTAVAVGDIGWVSANGSFIKTGELAGRAHLPATKELGEPPSTISTSGSVSFSAGADVRASDVVKYVADIGASVEVSFANETAAALILEDVIRREFADIQPVRELMTVMLADGKLEPNEIVVAYVKQAASGVIATSHNAESDVRGSVDAGLGGVIEVAKVGGRLQVVRQRGSQTTTVAEPGKPLTPMYRALAFHRNRAWWSFWRSTLEIRSTIAVRSFADPADDVHKILSDRPSLAVPRGETGE
jgi:hypothetical protein